MYLCAVKHRDTRYLLKIIQGTIVLVLALVRGTSDVIWYDSKGEVRRFTVWNSIWPDDVVCVDCRRQFVDSTVDCRRRATGNLQSSIFPYNSTRYLYHISESSFFPAAIPTINRGFDTTVHSEPFFKESWFFPVARSRQNTTSQKKLSRQITTSLCSGNLESHRLSRNVFVTTTWTSFYASFRISSDNIGRTCYLGQVHYTGT